MTATFSPSVGLLGSLTDSLFSAFFPDSCRLCDLPLADCSRVPVCESCWQKVRQSKPQNACVRCGVETASALALGPDGICAPCLSQPPSYDRVLSFSRYDGELRRLIHLLKYDRMRPLADRLGDQLGRLGLEAGSADLVLAAPMHWRRRRERGFNQAELVARRAALGWGLPFESKGLRRTKATPPQAGLTRAERLVNVRGAFQTPQPRLIKGRRIVLIDDVMTTGATLDACAKALKRAGAASVTAVTLARAVPEGSWSG